MALVVIKLSKYKFRTHTGYSKKNIPSEHCMSSKIIIKSSFDHLGASSFHIIRYVCVPGFPKSFVHLIILGLNYTPRSPKGEGGILFYVCSSFRPSKIFFVAFFSVTVDGRNLIFGHKRHIGIPYCG